MVERLTKATNSVPMNNRADIVERLRALCADAADYIVELEGALVACQERYKYQERLAKSRQVRLAKLVAYHEPDRKASKSLRS